MPSFKKFIFLLLYALTPCSIYAGEHMIGILMQRAPILENQPFRIIFAFTVDASDQAANLAYNDLRKIQQPFFSNFHIIDSIQAGYEKNTNYVYTNTLTTPHEELITYYYSYILSPKTRGMAMVEPMIVHALGDNYESDILFKPIMPGRLSSQDSLAHLAGIRKGFKVSDLTQVSSIDTILSKTYEILDWYDVPFMIGDHKDKPQGISTNHDTVYHIPTGHKFTVPYYISAVNVKSSTSGQLDSIDISGFKYPEGLVKHNEWIGTSVSQKKNYKEYTKNIHIVFTAAQKGRYTIKSFKMIVAGKKYKMPKVAVIVE